MIWNSIIQNFLLKIKNVTNEINNAAEATMRLIILSSIKQLFGAKIR